MDVVILPSRGASLEAAAKGAGAANSPLSVTRVFTGLRESGQRPPHGKYLVR